MSFEVREASLSDSEGIRNLFQRVFGREMTAAEWSWKYARDPDGWIAVVALHEGRIVGHFGACGHQALIGGQSRIVFSLVDVATDPAVRHLGGRRGVLRTMSESLFPLLRERGAPFGYGFPSPRHLRVGEKFIGYRGHFPVRELSFGVVGSPPGISEVSDCADSRLDALWEKAGFHLGRAALVRDRLRANWRYHARPERYYRMVTLRDGRGWGVLSGLGEIALVMDYQIEEPHGSLFGELFRALSSEGASMGAVRLVFWEPPGGPYRDFLLGSPWPSASPPSVQEAGFSFVTAVVFEELALSEFVRNFHLVAGAYDDR